MTQTLSPHAWPLKASRTHLLTWSRFVQHHRHERVGGLLEVGLVEFFSQVLREQYNCTLSWNMYDDSSTLHFDSEEDLMFWTLKFS